MLTAGDFPATIRVDLDVAYREGSDTGADETYRQMLRIIPTRSKAKEEVFYGDKGRLRRFRGERQPQSFNEYKQIVTLDKWEYTITVDSDVLEDDQTGGALSNKVRNFGNAVATSKEIETWEYLHNGTSIKGFDGQNLFDFYHVYTDSKGVDHNDFTGATQSNMHLGGSQLDATTLQLDQAHFANILSDKGKVMGMRLTHVATKRGSLNSKAARELSNSQFTVEASTARGQMTTNVFQGSFTHIEFDYGFGASEWLSMDLRDGEMKPIIILSHNSEGFDNLVFTQLLEDSDTGFWRDEFAFGVKGRFDWNPGDWRSVYLHGSSSYTFTPADSESQRILYPNA